VRWSGKAPTGEHYVTICSGGVKAEGEFPLAYCLDQQTAIRLWRDAIMAYAADKRGTLYWREEPMIEPDDLDFNSLPEGMSPTHPVLFQRPFRFFIVYSRLLISDKPPIYEICS